MISKLDFNWLDDFIANLPEELKDRRNIFEIAGFPHWEQVNSNFLAFYFDNKEDHKFESLFFDSLIELIHLKLGRLAPQFLDELTPDFTVFREFEFIDILIVSNNKGNNKYSYEWAILIENKIHANLYNDLKTYWNCVNVKSKKIGIVLTLKPLSDDENSYLQKLKSEGILYVHITHNELLSQVSLNIYQYFKNSDDRHLLFLKEYISNINYLYSEDKSNPNMETKLKEYQINFKKIKAISELEMELRRYISKMVFGTFKKFGFEPTNTKDSSKSKHLYPVKSFFDNGKLKHPEEFRIYIDIDDLLCYNNFFSAYELHSDFVEYGGKLKSKLTNLSLPQHVQFGERGKDTGTFYHIFILDIDLSNHFTDKDSLSEKLEEILEATLFNDKNNLVQLTTDKLKRIIKN
ncbi:MAG: PD-(D/E)XK nuclease family protein [Bacteroidales bacterium]|nr:PD-(D/E)XK nuclease family protein [Bacteroidales bacterium]